MVSANTRAIARRLLERHLDVALVEGPVVHARLEAIACRDDELVLIAHPHHQLVRRRRVEAAQLRGERFIVREAGSGTREVSERALAELGVTVSAALQLGSTEAVQQAVASGLGIAIVSRAAAADLLVLGRVAVVRLRGVALRRTLSELRLKGRSASAAARAFAGYLHHSGITQ